MVLVPCVWVVGRRSLSFGGNVPAAPRTGPRSPMVPAWRACCCSDRCQFQFGCQWEVYGHLHDVVQVVHGDLVGNSDDDIHEAAFVVTGGEELPKRFVRRLAEMRGNGVNNFLTPLTDIDTKQYRETVKIFFSARVPYLGPFAPRNDHRLGVVNHVLHLGKVQPGIGF